MDSSSLTVQVSEDGVDAVVEVPSACNGEAASKQLQGIIALLQCTTMEVVVVDAETIAPTDQPAARSARSRPRVRRVRRRLPRQRQVAFGRASGLIRQSIRSVQDAPGVWSAGTSIIYHPLQR
jgi:predicted nucleotidyltransferase